MQKRIILFALLSISAVSIMSLRKSPAKQVAIDGPAEKTYTQYCASCHGEKVEAFVDRQWKHGNKKEQIIASITGGYPELGMPTWKEVLTAQEIEKLADLIVEKIGRAHV